MSFWQQKPGLDLFKDLKGKFLLPQLQTTDTYYDHHIIFYRVVVRIVKYDQDPDNFNGFMERNKYYEHTVFLMLEHPERNERKRFNNIAALLLTEPIVMKPEEGISSACFPR